jgi:hypothetical protein
MGKDRGFPLRVSRPRAGNVLIEEVMPDKSSQAAGQVFEPDRPHKSLHVLGRRPKTKALAYEIPRWVPALSESVRNRPEVTRKRLSRPCR